MTEDVLNFLEETCGKRLRVHLQSGIKMDCVFDGFSYDYDDDGNEIMELTFERSDDDSLFDATPQEIEKIETM